MLFFFSFKTILHFMPSTDRKLELKAKTLVAQTGSQPFVYAKGLIQDTCEVVVYTSFAAIITVFGRSCSACQRFT
jgi:hypothetical protein